MSRLRGRSSGRQAAPAKEDVEEESCRRDLWRFLEAETTAGQTYQFFTVVLIVAAVVSFIVSSVFNQEYNISPETGKYIGPTWCDWCDAAFFGNEDDGLLRGTSFLEVFSVVIFTIDYFLRLYSCIEDPEYSSRLSYACSFFALVDLVSILPFYIDRCLTSVNLPAAQFFRILRLVRMVRVQGRFAEAFTLFDDVIVSNAKLLGTAGFVGSVVWVVAAGFYYVAERRNLQMVYCPACTDIDVSMCRIDEWGLVNCAAGLAAANCPATTACWNLFQSIPNSMFFTVLNLFGEFPLASQQGAWGKVVATAVAVVAVFIFAIPTGIIGNGFSEQLKKRKEEKEALLSSRVARGGYGAAGDDRDSQSLEGIVEDEVIGSDTCRGGLYNLLNGRTPTGRLLERFISILIVTSVVTFFVETLEVVRESPETLAVLNKAEFFTVCVFTAEYALRILSVGEDPAYAGCSGMLKFMTTFFSIVDLLSIVPYWISVSRGGSTSLAFIRAFRLLRLFRVEGLMQAFTILIRVVRSQGDVLIVLAFVTAVLWIVFSALMYFAERGSPDVGMRAYYQTMPEAMWVTFINLTGEKPLAMFTPAGQVIQACMGLFAVGVFGIPIGILGAGFQDWVEEHQKDAAPEEEDPALAAARAEAEEAEDGGPPESWRRWAYDLVNGGGEAGHDFDVLLVSLILVSILLAILQTMPGLACDHPLDAGICAIFFCLEAVASIFFTAEYLLRLLAAPSRCGYIFSFYAIIDLAAVMPWYVAIVNPGGWTDRHNSVFLTLKVLRLLKLDKYVPSLSLVREVFHIKRDALMVTGIVAGIIWILFSSMMYLAESTNTATDIGDIPLLDCGSSGCKQADRYHNAIAAMPYTLMHLHGDYPIIDYSWTGRGVAFLMVVAGVGLVGIPSGLIASGFVELVKKKKKDDGEDESSEGTFEREFAKLGDTRAPREYDSDTLDTLQDWVNQFLNGSPKKSGEASVRRSPMSRFFRAMIFLLILLNAAAVLAESMPTNRDFSSAFRIFEAVSVAIFTFEYVLRLFSVTKDKQHLYSRWFYATTFFGVVDLLSILPFYVQLLLTVGGVANPESAAVFRVLRLFRLLELERFVVAFTVLDNVFRKSRLVLLATGLMAFAIWISSASLFYVFEGDNPNWCNEWADSECAAKWSPSCECKQRGAFSTMPDSLYWSAILVSGEWALIDLTVGGKLLCLFLCLVGVAIYALPVGTLFDSFGAVLEGGLEALEEEDDDGKKD